MATPLGGFNWVHKTFWDDMAIREASADARALALYLLTCPTRATEGFYRLRMVNVCDDTRMAEPSARAAMAELGRIGFAEYDDHAEVVLILKALKYQPPRGPKSIQGAIASVGRVHGAPRLFAGLLDAADRYAPDFAQALRKHYGIVTAHGASE